MQIITISLWCYACQERRDFIFVNEVDGWEVYQCPACRSKASYKVQFGYVYDESKEAESQP